VSLDVTVTACNAGGASAGHATVTEGGGGGTARWGRCDGCARQQRSDAKLRRLFLRIEEVSARREYQVTNRLFFIFLSHIMQLTPQEQSAESRNIAGAEALAVARRPEEASFFTLSFSEVSLGRGAPVALRPQWRPSVSVLKHRRFMHACRRVNRASWPLQDIVLLRGVCARINHPFIAPSHLHRPHYCNTITLLLRNRRRPPTALWNAIYYTILVMTISCKGQRASKKFPLAVAIR